MTAVVVSGDDLAPHQQALWSIAYRMTGVAADADDIVQDTFARALTHPPTRDRPVRPWLVKVAMNLARDLLRRRRHTAYVGPWLPSPVDDDALDLAPVEVDQRPTPEQRYSLRESASFAFLLAVEQLTPIRRAVLILRDVFDYSTHETAQVLGTSTDAVKQNLARARKSLASYDANREPLAHKHERDERTLGKLFFALARGDTDAVEDLLADDVEAHTDGGGIYAAARVVLHGPEKVALVFANLARLMSTVGRAGMKIARLNGSVMYVLNVEVTDAWQKRAAPRSVLSVDTDARGKIVRVYSVLAPRKLTRL